jgi:hypothetical protein
MAGWECADSSTARCEATSSSQVNPTSSPTATETQLWESPGQAPSASASPGAALLADGSIATASADDNGVSILLRPAP